MSRSRAKRSCRGTSAAAGLCLLVAWAAPAADELSRREAELQRQYLDLERSFLRLADLLGGSDPRRAAVLREAFDLARGEEVGEGLGRIVQLLEKGRLLEAGASQEASVEQFRGLLGLLEEGGGDRSLADAKRQVREFLGRVTKLIARQRDIEGSTEAGGDASDLGERQRKTADETAELSAELDRFAGRFDERRPVAGGAEAGRPAEGTRRDAGGAPAEPAAGPSGDGESGTGAAESGEQEPGEQEPGEQEPGGDDDASRARRTRRRLQEAERSMRAARERLEDATRREARAEQERAIEALETARAELQEILRQMREQEVERLLVQLETRLRMMLRAERGIQAAAKKLATDATMGPRERRIEAVRIAREQDEVTAEADRALVLVRDDGSAAAVPEALAQVRDDSAQAATALGRGDTGGGTLAIVADIVAGLEELVAALEKSRADRDDSQRQRGSPGGRPAEPDEQPLVDKLAELKMLRSLQLRVNERTQRFARFLGEVAERAEEPELLEALGRLAERQRAIERAARDIVTGRTE